MAFQPDDVVYWVDARNLRDEVGVAIVRSQDSDLDRVIFSAWRFNIGWFDSDGVTWGHPAYPYPADKTGISTAQVRLHPDPDRIWAEYCASQLIDV